MEPPAQSVSPKHKTSGSNSNAAYTDGSGIPTDKGGTCPEQGEDAGEDKADRVIYHSNQKNLEKVRQTVDLCWDFTLGLSPAKLFVTWPISGTARAEFHDHAPKGSD